MAMGRIWIDRQSRQKSTRNRRTWIKEIQRRYTSKTDRQREREREREAGRTSTVLQRRSEMRTMLARKSRGSECLGRPSRNCNSLRESIVNPEEIPLTSLRTTSDDTDPDDSPYRRPLFDTNERRRGDANRLPKWYVRRCTVLLCHFSDVVARHGFRSHIRLQHWRSVFMLSSMASQHRCIFKRDVHLRGAMTSLNLA